jgi:predicted NBD/HSP70 family sugar kinase
MGKNPLGNRNLIRAINRSTVLNTIKTQGQISRIALAQNIGLSPATISAITAELIDDSLIFEKAQGDSRGGRRPILLALNPHGGFVVGLKLTEEDVIGAITDLEATVIANHTTTLPDHELGTILAAMEAVVHSLVATAGIPASKLLGVGLGLAGIINAHQGMVRYSPIFGWRDLPLAALLQGKLRVAVRIDNDVNTLTLTEQLFGAGQGFDDFLTVTVGRGVGLGIVVNGQLYRGGNRGSGEFGHTVLDPEGPLCLCGKQGCLETYVSDSAILRQAEEAILDQVLPPEAAEMNTLLQLAREGNPVAIGIFHSAGEKLGRGIANLINVFNPEKIILSGEGVRAGELLFGPMQLALQTHVMPGFRGDTEIRIDVWEDAAWARGAASLLLLELFKSPLFIEKTEVPA